MPKTKPARPAWNPGAIGTEGCLGYWLLGGNALDLSPNGHHGTIVGEPSWGSGDHGPELSGFSTSDYVTMDSAAVHANQYPRALAVLFRTTDTIDQYLFALGRSTTNTPVYCLSINRESVPLVGLFARDDAAQELTELYEEVDVGDESPHVLHAWSISSTEHHLALDGAVIASSTSTLGSSTFDRLTLGLLRRTTDIGPCAGAAIAAGAWVGSVPDPARLAADWLSGTFAAARGGFLDTYIHDTYFL